MDTELIGIDFCVVGTDFLVQVLESYLLVWVGFFFWFCFVFACFKHDSMITLQCWINYLMELGKLPFNSKSLEFSMPRLSWVGLMLVCPY